MIGLRKRRFDTKTRGECSNQLCMDSRQITDEARSPTTRNRMNVTSVKHCGCRLIHGDLSHLPSHKWSFICINGEKCFRTMWKELAQENPEVFDHCSDQTFWNTSREREMGRPLTQEEEVQRKKGVPHKQIAQNRPRKKRPDGIAF